jgi:hypothetical protein
LSVTTDRRRTDRRIGQRVIDRLALAARRLEAQAGIDQLAVDELDQAVVAEAPDAIRSS